MEIIIDRSNETREDALLRVLTTLQLEAIIQQDLGTIHCVFKATPMEIMAGIGMYTYKWDEDSGRWLQ